MIDDDGWHDDGMMEELEKMLDLKPVEVHHDEAEEKHKELDPAEYDYESDGADGGPSDGVPPEVEGGTPRLRFLYTCLGHGSPGARAWRA